MNDQDLSPPDLLVAAKERLRIAPVPEWVTPCAFDMNFKSKQTGPLTLLLLNRQLHAEHRQSYVHTVTRLETMHAVQHESQWRLQFEPVTQSLTIHWVRVCRGEQQFNHANLEKIRLLQREEGLEGFVIDGWVTLLLLLDDVRPGDLLDVSYTIEDRPRLFPEGCSAFWRFPQGVPIGKLHFALRFNSTRAMKWKSSSIELSPKEHTENGEIFWNWTCENCTVPEPEVATPEWHIGFPWVQISDCPSWGEVATAFALTWKEEPDDEELARIAEPITSTEPDLLLRVEKAIQLVQDQHRYLSVNLELGGQVPRPPGVVVRQRFGDCKDISFLLVHLLKRLGAEARPVLVNTRLRKSIADLLPMAGLFNHAVVEFKVRGQTRWVDATLKLQGGGALNRSIPDYGPGLPVDTEVISLVQLPQSSMPRSAYEFSETILLDTSGADSVLAATLRATGSHADSLRQQFEMVGLDKVAEERLQICGRRFVNARRSGPLQYRDDRTSNEFILSEVFEIQGFLTREPQPGVCTFRLPENLILHLLRLPERGARRAPLALPYPCDIVHTIEVEANSLTPMAGPRCNLASTFLRFGRRERSLNKSWSVTLTLTTLADSVPAAQLQEHEKMVENVWRESMVGIYLPTGIAHPRRRRDFGDLPPALPLFQRSTPSPQSQIAALANTPSPETAAALPHLVTQSSPAPQNSTPGSQTAIAATPRAPLEATHESRSRRRRRTPPRSRIQAKHILWAIVVGVAIIILTFIIVVLAHNPLR